MRNRCLLIGLAVAAVVHGLLAWICRRPQGPGSRRLWGDETAYLEAARRIASGESSGLDLLWPPGYAHFLAPLVGSADGAGSLLPVFAVQGLLLVATAFLLRDALAQMIGPGVAPDLMAGLVLGYPPLAAYCYYLWPEVLHLALMALGLWILAARRDDLRWIFGFGITLGLAITVKSLLGPFLPFLLLPLAVGVPWRKGLARLTLAVLALGLVLGPIAWSNGQREGVFTVANSARFNLWVGLNSVSTKNFVNDSTGALYDDYLLNGPTFAHRNRILAEQIDRFVDEHGVGTILLRQVRLQYFRLFDKDSNLTDQLPGGALAERGFGYDRPPRSTAFALRYGSYFAYLGLLLAAVAGFVIRPPWSKTQDHQADQTTESAIGNPRHQSWRWLWLPTLFAAYNLGIFLLLHVKSRYRVALLPVLFLFAVLAAQWFVDRRRDRYSGRPPEPAPGWLSIALGIGVGTLLLGLALGGRLLMP